MMKTRLALFVATIAVGLFFTSCEEDENVVPKPVIEGLELGHGNTRIAQAGEDMHMDAEIFAEGRIDVISVEIHKEDGSGDDIEAEYTDYAGQKNASFHRHIDIPAGTPAGEYHFHLTVTDQEGNSTSVEEEIMIEQK